MPNVQDEIFTYAIRVETVSEYGLIYIPTGRLVRLEPPPEREVYEGGFDYWGLSLSEHHGVFKVDTPRKAAIVRDADCHRNVSTAERPGWEGVDVEKTRIVEIHRTLTFRGPPGCDPSKEEIEITACGTFLKAERHGLVTTKDKAAVMRSIFGATVSIYDEAYVDVVIVKSKTELDLTTSYLNWVRSGWGSPLGVCMNVAPVPDGFEIGKYVSGGKPADNRHLHFVLVDTSGGNDVRFEKIRA